MFFFSKILFCGLMAATPAWANSVSDVAQPKTSAPAADSATDLDDLIQAFDALEGRTEELEASLAEAKESIAMIEDKTDQADEPWSGQSDRRLQRQPGANGVIVKIVDGPISTQSDRRRQRRARFDGVTVKITNSRSSNGQVMSLGSDQSDRRLRRVQTSDLMASVAPAVSKVLGRAAGRC